MNGNIGKDSVHLSRLCSVSIYTGTCVCVRACKCVYVCVRLCVCVCATVNTIQKQKIEKGMM